MYYTEKSLKLLLILSLLGVESAGLGVSVRKTNRSFPKSHCPCPSSLHSKCTTGKDQDKDKEILNVSSKGAGPRLETLTPTSVCRLPSTKMSPFSTGSLHFY